MKVKVPVIGTVNRSVQVETDAPSRTEMNAAIQAAVDNAAPSGGGSGVASVIWRFIREVPANIVKLAALGTNGLITRKVNGDIVARSIAVADSSRLTITNADGDAGSPTLDVADIASHTIIARDSGSTGKPAAAGLSAVLDFLGSVAQGDLLYRAASNWAYLAPGTAEQPLWSGGASANPSWGRKLIAGTNITFDDSVSGERTIAASGGSSGVNITPETHPASPDAMDDEFEAGSLDTGKWTWRQQGGASAALAGGSLVLTGAADAGTPTVRAIEQTISGSGEWIARIGGYAPANFAVVGLGFSVSSGRKGMVIGFHKNDSSPTQRIVVIKWASETSFSATPVDVANSLQLPDFMSFRMRYMKVKYDGTNVIFQTSPDGVPGSYITLFSEAKTTFLGTPDRVNLQVTAFGASTPVLVCDLFRKVA